MSKLPGLFEYFRICNAYSPDLKLRAMEEMPDKFVSIHNEVERLRNENIQLKNQLDGYITTNEKLSEQIRKKTSEADKATQKLKQKLTEENQPYIRIISELQESLKTMSETNKHLEIRINAYENPRVLPQICKACGNNETKCTC